MHYPSHRLSKFGQIEYETVRGPWKVTPSQLDITNESQEVSLFKAGDHKVSINRRARKHNKNKTEKCHLNVKGVQFFRLQIWTEISHSLGLQKSTANQIRLEEL